MLVDKKRYSKKSRETFLFMKFCTAGCPSPPTVTSEEYSREKYSYELTWTVQSQYPVLQHQIIAEHMGDLRSRFSIVSIDFEKQELFGSQDYQLNQECMKCNVGHQRVGLPTECNAKLK